MASQQTLLSPAELAYLHSSLSLRPPIRPDGRSPTQFRPLTAETGVLPGTNGSARVCFADGTEAIVGVKAELEKTADGGGGGGGAPSGDELEGRPQARRAAGEDGGEEDERKVRGDWLEMAVEIPGQRDDEAATVFLAEMLREALLADGHFAKKLWINSRFHWRLYLDVSVLLQRHESGATNELQILLISPPLSYPLPLLSLTTHLALLATRLPKLTSEGDEDPMFDDDWDASTFLYPRDNASGRLRISAADHAACRGRRRQCIIFDPGKGGACCGRDGARRVRVGSEERGAGRTGRWLSWKSTPPPVELTPARACAHGGGSALEAADSARSAQCEPTSPLGGTRI